MYHSIAFQTIEDTERDEETHGISMSNNMQIELGKAMGMNRIEGVL